MQCFWQWWDCLLYSVMEFFDTSKRREKVKGTHRKHRSKWCGSLWPRWWSPQHRKPRGKAESAYRGHIKHRVGWYRQLHFHPIRSQYALDSYDWTYCIQMYSMGMHHKPGNITTHGSLRLLRPNTIWNQGYNLQLSWEWWHVSILWAGWHTLAWLFLAVARTVMYILLSYALSKDMCNTPMLLNLHFMSV